MEWLIEFINKLKLFFGIVSKDSFGLALNKLILTAIWAVDQMIDFTSDIFSWINGNLERLLNDGANDVNVIIGDALSDFIKQNQEMKGKYSDVTSGQLDVLCNSVINVATDIYGNVVDEQMIRSDKGLSENTRAVFNGQPTLKIKIAV